MNFPKMEIERKKKNILASSTNSMNARRAVPAVGPAQVVAQRLGELFSRWRGCRLTTWRPRTSSSVTGESNRPLRALRCQSNFFSHLPWIRFLIKRLIRCISSSPPFCLYKFMWGSKWEEAGNSKVISCEITGLLFNTVWW